MHPVEKPGQAAIHLRVNFDLGIDPDQAKGMLEAILRQHQKACGIDWWILVGMTVTKTQVEKQIELKEAIAKMLDLAGLTPAEKEHYFKTCQVAEETRRRVTQAAKTQSPRKRSLKRRVNP
jgi:hypothetical protein